jgi:hypothetical protein
VDKKPDELLKLKNKKKITMPNGAISPTFFDLTICVRRICVTLCKIVKKHPHSGNAQKQRFVKKHFFSEKVKKRPHNSPPSNKN